MESRQTGIQKMSSSKISAPGHTSPGPRRLGLLGCLVAAACLLLGALGAAPALATIHIDSFDGLILDDQGQAETQAGAHPFSASTSIQFESHIEDSALGPINVPNEDPKDLVVDLPAGFVGNPQAVPQCTSAQLLGGVPGGCPADSEVGSSVTESLFTLPGTVYNMVPGPNEPARFGFVALILPVFIHARIRTESDYGLSTVIPNLSNSAPITGTSLTFNGQANGQPFLSNPTACRGALVSTLHVDSWQSPGDVATAEFISHDTSTPPLTGGPTGCDQLSFDPTLDVQPSSSAADSPTGMTVDLGIPQTDDLNSLATAHLERTVVNLPQGLSINPAAADGLSGCSPSQIALGSAAEPHCADSSKIGTMEIDTPLLPEPMQGSIYLAQQNSFQNSMFAIYLVAEEQGVLVKLPGKVEADSQTGQLEATFENTPQVPFSDFKLNFFGGPRAVFANPPRCGTYQATSEVTPWSAAPSVPDSGPPATPSDSFQITSGPGGGPCPSSPFAPSFHAGTQSPLAGAASPFIVRLSRADGTEELSSLDVDLPPGMLAHLAGVPQCSDAQVQLAALGAGGCPAASRVGGVKVGAGAGSSPLYLPGNVYLTGGYRGAPFGLAIVVRALAGPFDLGTIVVRAALVIDLDDTQIHVITDPIPDIVKGIPLRLRDIQVVLDRPNFTVNPTNCNPTSVHGLAHGLEGSQRGFDDHFQLGGCSALGFAPQLQGAILGGPKQSKRSSHPNLQFDAYTTPGEANLSAVGLRLPRTFQIDAFNLANLCTETELAMTQCAGHAAVGISSAETPLLAGGLSGPIYAVSGGGLLPRLAVILRGQPSEPIALLIRGDVTTPGGRIQNEFGGIPDAPLSHFRLTIYGGPGGLLVNNTNLCAKKKGKKGKKGKKAKGKKRVKVFANAAFVGHNGDTRSQKVPIAHKCKKGKKKKKKH